MSFLACEAHSEEVLTLQRRMPFCKAVIGKSHRAMRHCVPTVVDRRECKILWGRDDLVRIIDVKVVG